MSERWVLFVCGECGETVKLPEFNISTPNRYCWHNDHVVLMQEAARGPE